MLENEMGSANAAFLFDEMFKYISARTQMFIYYYFTFNETPASVCVLYEVKKILLKLEGKSAFIQGHI